MTVGAMPMGGGKPRAHVERLPGWRLWAATSVNLAYGFMMADQGMLLAPLEAEHLFGEQASLGLALMAICCGLSQLTGPAAGRWSDRHRSIYGRRRPCLVMAMISVLVLTSSLAVSSDMRLRSSFLIIFLLQQFAWNCLQTVQAGLVPDVVAPDQRSSAGGAAAASTLAGAFLALLGVRFLGGLGTQAHYAMTVSVGVVCVALVCASVSEMRTDNLLIDDAVPEIYDPVTFVRHLRECYEFDPRRHPNFAKLLLSKTLYCSSVMVKGFLLFFIQDTFKLRNAKREQAIVGDTAVAAEALAACAALAAMWALDAVAAEVASRGKELEEDAGLTAASEQHAGAVAGAISAVRARKSAVTGACWMCVMWMGPPLVGYGVLRDAQALERVGLTVNRGQLAAEWAPYMVLGTAIWGIGQGIYLAGDQALSYALLPDPEEASRLLGLTSVCSAVGAVCGGGATGLLLYIFGAGQDNVPVHLNHLSPPQNLGAPGYGYAGYAAMFLLASCLSGSSCLVLQRVRTAAEMSGERARLMGPPASSV